ncbi:hypothetical protein Q4595_20810, partial [Wenyingzhuangia sp. 1_MG-2023]|nr:hypothetical protein [Wenyingzhuangia sp. 1_MG-2023]
TRQDVEPTKPSSKKTVALQYRANIYVCRIRLSAWLLPIRNSVASRYAGQHHQDAQKETS